MGLGGGFLMNLFIEKEGKAYTINARERAPILAKNESYNAHKSEHNKSKKLVLKTNELGDHS